MRTQPKGTKGKLSPQQSAAPGRDASFLDLTPEFPGQLSSDLEGRTLFPVPPAERSHHGGNMPTLSPPGWVVKVNELVFVKCFEIVDERPYEVKCDRMIIKLPCLRSDSAGTGEPGREDTFPFFHSPARTTKTVTCSC